MPGTETEGPSPRGALSKLLRNKGSANVSTASLGAPIDGDDIVDGGGLRASMDAAIDKVKERTRRRSVDDRSVGDDVPNRRLSNLLSRRKRSPKKDTLDVERNMSGDSRTGSLLISGNRSESSLLDDSGHSSLLTDDQSESEGLPTRPSLSPHQSHAGLLTLSSPELHAQSQSVISASEVLKSPHATLLPTDSSTSIPKIVEPGDTESLPPSVTTNRSAPPIENSNSAFTLPRNQAIGDSDSAKSGSVRTGGLGGLFKSRSRANSVSSQQNREDTQVDQLLPITKASAAEAAKSKVQGAESDERPETPDQLSRGQINTASLPATPPNLVETPTTLITPPTPTDPNANVGTFPTRHPPASPLKGSPSSGRSLNSIESIRHRRAQSANIPSKLSNSIPPPLTPTVEEAKTPGGTLTQPTNASGFFSSFFTSAQKAADQISNSVNSTIGGQNKTKPGPPQTVTSDEEVIPGFESRPEAANVEGTNRRAAVETLGKGDLSLSHLGIPDSEDASPMNSVDDLSLQNASTLNGEIDRKAEEDAAARAVSVAYEKPVQGVISQAAGRPISAASNDRLNLIGEHIPPRSATDADGIKRSGSVRSRISGRRRRHRASSATTGTVGTTGTIATAIQSTASTLANPGAVGAGHRLTGFAVASNKRNKDFHQLFRSVPEDDYLIEDYSAALQRDILLHGRLYVSESHICFSSNILGWVTNLVISFDEVVCVEKKSTAVIFPNAIVIQTLQARHTFASFVARDSTYELLIGIWKISHPNLKSSLNGVTLDNAGTGDKTEVADPEISDEDSVDGSDDEVYDEDADDDAGSSTDGGVAPSIGESDAGDLAVSRKTSTAPISSAPPMNGAVVKGQETTDATAAAAPANSDPPGPAMHAPTECGDEHYDRPITDVLIQAPLGKVYTMIFGPASGPFMKKWLVEDQKSRELNWPEGHLDNDHKTFVFDYIKPLNAPVGPRQTKCITTNTLLACDLEKAVTIDCSTQTPDVPSGNVFTTKTRYCFMWAPGNATRMVATCTIEWTGKSWLKGPIEKGANDGQIEYVKALVAAVKAVVVAKPPTKGPGKKGRRKGKAQDPEAEVAAVQALATVPEQTPTSWGPLEPLHQILDAVVSIFRPFITSQVIIAVLLVLLMYAWMVPSRAGRSSISLAGHSSPERLAAYEEIWRREESELWDWLEDRAGLSGAMSRQAKDMAKQMVDERMSGRQMDNAILVTEEKLAALKEAVGRKKGTKGREPKLDL